jgi:hypothetical protein
MRISVHLLRPMVSLERANEPRWSENQKLVYDTSVREVEEDTRVL